MVEEMQNKQRLSEGTFSHSLHCSVIIVKLQEVFKKYCAVHREGHSSGAGELCKGRERQTADHATSQNTFKLFLI